MNVAISWAKKVQLAKCDILVGFPKSSHILCMEQPKLIVSSFLSLLLFTAAVLCKCYCLQAGYQVLVIKQHKLLSNKKHQQHYDLGIVTMTGYINI